MHSEYIEQRMASVDYIEVQRKAHELAERMGWSIAKAYAAQMAADALAEGHKGLLDFWKAVELNLTPRSDPSLVV